MLRILDRYILRELAFSVIATAVVLLVIVAGGTFARVLQQVADGSYPPGVMFQVLGLKMLAALAGLLPLALFLGVLVALGRLYHDSEMHVLAACGMGKGGVLRPAALLAVPTAIVIGLVSLWLGPWSGRTSDSLIAEANRSVIAAGLEAGRFTELPGQGGIIFVDSMNRTGTQLGQVFVARQRDGNAGEAPEIKVITAKRGLLYQESDGSGRYLALIDGWQFSVPLGRDDWDRMRYARNDTALSQVQSEDDDVDTAIASTPTLSLLGANDPKSRAELAWRIAAPVTSLVLVMLALPLARQTPREPRYGRMLIAVLCYFLYFSVLSLARAMISQGRMQAGPIWALHLVVVGLSVWFLWRQYAPRRVRGAPA